MGQVRRLPLPEDAVTWLEDQPEPLTVEQLEALVDAMRAISSGSAASGADLDRYFASIGGKPRLEDLIDRLRIARQRQRKERDLEA